MTRAAWRPCCIATGATPGRTSADPSGWRTLTMSPMASTSGCPGTDRSPSTAQAPGAVDLDSGLVGQQPRQRRGDHAGGPDDGARRDPLSRLVGAPDGDAAARRRSTTDSLEPPGDAEVLQRAQRLGGEALGEGRQDAVQRLDEQDARRSLGSMVRKSPRRSRAISAIWPAISTPVGPAPTTTKVSSSAWRAGSASSSAASKALRICAADGERALQRLELGGVLLPLVVAEVGVLRAARDDQRVVVDRLGRGPQRDVAQRDAARAEVDTGDLGEDDAHVAPAAEDAPQRIADLGRREGARGHLVGQRLEQVEVAPVDQRDVDRQPRELQAGLEPAEAASDDDDAVRRGLDRRRHGADPAGCARAATSRRAPRARVATERG